MPKAKKLPRHFDRGQTPAERLKLERGTLFFVRPRTYLVNTRLIILRSSFCADFSGFRRSGL